MSAGVRLIAGLWNPEPEYEHTRHNAGAELVAGLASRFDVPMKAASQLMASVGAGEVGGVAVRLMIPNLNMNDSGRAVAAVARYFKIPPESVLVVYDELDLALGKVRLKQGGGAGGHNGIRSVVSCLGTAEFWRLRLGIGRPAPHGKGSAPAILKYVLSRAPVAERAAVEEAGESVARHLDVIVSGRMTEAMNLLHKPQPGAADAADDAADAAGD